MKASPLARLIVLGFVCIFLSATGYLLLDSLGIWTRLPAPVTRGVEVATGLILLFALIGHLALATGQLPPADSRGDQRS